MKKRVMSILMLASVVGAIGTNITTFSTFSSLSPLSYDTVHAANDYTQNLLTVYKIPSAVIQAIIDNSVATNGKTPKANGKTVTNFTVADFRDLTTVSLANRVKDVDGTYTSMTNDAVATAVGSVQMVNAGALADSNSQTPTGLVSQNFIGDSRQTDMVNLLKNGGYATDQWNQQGNRQTVYTTANIWLNQLVALIATNPKLTTLDLTGAFSKVPFDSGFSKAGLLIGMMVNKSATLQSLALGFNPIIANEVQSNAWTYYNYALNLPALTNLDLQSNQLTVLDTQILQNVQNNLTTLNLAGNAISKITTNAEGVFNQATVDLSNADFTNLDPSTHKILASALNSGKGGLELSDTATNQLITASINDGWQDVNVNASGLNKVADQLDSSTVDKIATTKPTLVDDKVMATLVTSNASALTGDSVTQIVKANPNVVDADTLTKLETNNPAAITSDTLEHLASTNATAISPDVISKVGATNPDAITSGLINNLAEAGQLDADTLATIAATKPSVVTNLTPEQKETITKVVGADDLSKVQDILDNPNASTPVVPSNPAPMTHGKVSVDKTTLSFGTPNVTDIQATSVVKADTGLRVTGTVTKGQSLRLLASEWTALDGTSSFAPTLQLTGEDAVNNKGVDQAVAAGDSTELLRATADNVDFDVTLDSVGMTNITGVQAGKTYAGSLTWQLNNLPGTTTN